MKLSLKKIIDYAYGSINRRLYLHTSIVALFLLIAISISIWTGNTLTMITAIARFERTHSVSRVEAMVALLKHINYAEKGTLETFYGKMAITQSYNKVFSSMLDMSKTKSNAEFARILEDTFAEADQRTAVITVNRMKVLYWHPLVKELVGYAVVANAAGEKIKALVPRVLSAKNEKERRMLLTEIDKEEKIFVFCETSFSRRYSDLAIEISTYMRYFSIILMVLSVGFTGLLSYMIAKTVFQQAAKHTSNLEREIQERKRAEENLCRMNAFLDSVVENIPNMIFLKDAENLRFVRFNRAGEDLLGYSRNDLLGKNDYDFFPKEQADHFTKKDREVLHGKEVVDIPEEPLQTRYRGERTMHTKKVPLLDMKGEPEYLLGIAEDITDRKRAEEQLQDTLESLRKAVGTTIQVISSTVEARDPYTSGHQIRSADLARAIAIEMDLPQDKIDGIRMAGSIHDIGKISIPAEILAKPTKLSDIEFSLIKEHARQGYEMLKDVESPWPLAEIVYQHHERIDGSGYPRNLKGDEICMEARILAVADVVEAMASHRPYRAGLGIDSALNEIEKNRGIFYDEAVVDVCLRLFRGKGFKFEGT